MKKLISYIFVFSISFFAFIISSSAWVGEYVYGINRIGFDSNKKFIVEGWAVISDQNGNEIPNINPNFSLEIKFYKDSTTKKPFFSEMTAKEELPIKIEGKNGRGRFYEVYKVLTDDLSVKNAYCENVSCLDYRNNYFLFELDVVDTIDKIMEENKVEIIFDYIKGFETWYLVSYPKIYFEIDLIVSTNYNGNEYVKRIRNINFLEKEVIGKEIITEFSKKINFTFANNNQVLSIVQGGHFRNVNNFESIEKSARFEVNNDTPWGISIITGQKYDVAEVNSYNIPGTLVPKYTMYRLNFDGNYISKSARKINNNQNYTCDGEYTWSNEKGCWGVSREPSPVWAKPGSGKSAWVPQFWITLPSSSTPHTFTPVCKSTCPLPNIIEKFFKEIIEYPDGSVLVKDNPDKEETKTYACDISEKSETITSTLPHIQKETIFDNGYCNVQCEEDVSIKYEGKKYVTAGMWFKYPIKMDGNRVCTFDFYGYRELFEQIGEFKRIVKENPCQDECFYGWIERIKKLTKAYSQCAIAKDNFITGPNKYVFNAKVNGEFEMSGGIQKKVEYKKISDGSLTNTVSNESYICVDKDFSNFSPCSPGGEGNRVIISTKWNLNSNIKDAIYDIANVYYSEQSTGRVVTENEMSPTEKYYLAGEDGRVFFSDMKDASCSYPFKIFVDGIARNIGEYWERRKNVEITCEYKVEKGLITYPQTPEKGFCPETPSCPTGDCPNDCPPGDISCCTPGESGCPKSGINVKYRQISLNKVFPTVSKQNKNYYGTNWLSEEGKNVAAKIEKKGYSLYNQRPIYSFKAGVFQNVAVKLYNLTHKYGEFNLNEQEQSKFINGNLDKYKRGN